jgi:hypothetical protein
MKTKILKHKRIESYLPVFPGFYNTIFEATEDNIIESPYTYDDYDFNYKQYEIDMTKECVYAIERQLPEYGIKGVSIIWQSISSPREYNFTNDSINVLYKLTNESLSDLNKYIIDNSEAFQKFLTRKFTSCSGFISFYSPSLEVWINEYLNDKNKLETCFGSLLEFIFENEGYTQEDLYYACDSVYLDGNLKESIQGDVNDKIDSFTKDNYLTSDVNRITSDLISYFDCEAIKYEWLNYNYIESKVKYIFNSFASLTTKLF